jgi:hypothetical protein
MLAFEMRKLPAAIVTDAGCGSRETVDASLADAVANP